jgi:hypothetical protein
MKLEETYIVEVMKVKEYVGSKGHKLSSVTKRITKRNKTNKGQQSTEDKKKK